MKTELVISLNWWIASLAVLIFILSCAADAFRDRCSRNSQFKSSHLFDFRDDIFNKDHPDFWKWKHMQGKTKFRTLLNFTILVPFSDFWHWAKTQYIILRLLYMCLLILSVEEVHTTNTYWLLLGWAAIDYSLYVAIFSLVYHKALVTEGGFKWFSLFAMFIVWPFWWFWNLLFGQYQVKSKDIYGKIYNKDS